MPSIQFEDLGSSLSRLPQVIQSVPDVIRNPAANPLQAVILLGIAILIVLIVLMSAILLLMRSPDIKEEPLSEDQLLTVEEQRETTAAERSQRRLAWLTTTCIIILVGTTVWVAAGITTTSPEVCTSCHSNTAHEAAKREDPHANVECVYCHEGGGAFARATVNVVPRIQHVVLARTRPGLASSFGTPVASDKCYSCHRATMSGVFYDEELGVKVSHKEPLAAGAQCVDCHALRSGAVTAATVGMAPCLRCHDGVKAKAECSVCHTGDPSRAIRPSVGPTEMASVQVPNPQCGGCHKDMTKCDNCHGIRMPHSVGFKLYYHARPAAIAIWSGKAQMCSKCHYSGHNACQRAGCHVGVFPSHPSPTWRTVHGLTSWDDSARTCGGCHYWNPYDHDGMNFCAVCHTARPQGSKP